MQLCRHRRAPGNSDLRVMRQPMITAFTYCFQNYAQLFTDYKSVLGELLWWFFLLIFLVWISPVLLLHPGVSGVKGVGGLNLSLSCDGKSHSSFYDCFIIFLNNVFALFNCLCPRKNLTSLQVLDQINHPFTYCFCFFQT